MQVYELGRTWTRPWLSGLLMSHASFLARKSQPCTRPFVVAKASNDCVSELKCAIATTGPSARSMPDFTGMQVV